MNECSRTCCIECAALNRAHCIVRTESGALVCCTDYGALMCCTESAVRSVRCNE